MSMAHALVAMAMVGALVAGATPARAGDALGCCVCDCPTQAPRCTNDATESECPGFCIGGDCVMESFSAGIPCAMFRACAGPAGPPAAAPLMGGKALGTMALTLAAIGVLAARRRRSSSPH